jgi:hypothetical protein
MTLFLETEFKIETKMENYGKTLVNVVDFSSTLNSNSKSIQKSNFDIFPICVESMYSLLFLIENMKLPNFF